MRHKSIMALVVGLALAGPASGSDRAAELGRYATLGGGEYSTGGGITVAVETREIEGRLALCGVWAQSDALPVYVRRSGKEVLSKGSIALDGRVVTRKITFLPRVDVAESYAGAPARCKVFKRAWEAGFEQAQIDIRLPRQLVYISASGERGARPRIWFGPSAHSNPAQLRGSLLPQLLSRIRLPGAGE